ncbi:MAG: hypothetical protein HY424_01995 [Candidatus Levybacteria bacterium]|nr:hypothetical protein [Candidatus Levybacteria bacterium]
MINYQNWGGYGMMNSGSGIANIFWIVLLVDLIFLGVWLWKQIQKK